MAKLSYAQKSRLPSSDFAVKGTGNYGGKGSFPIPDVSHARNALARAASKGPKIQAQVRAKVHAKFPGIGKKGRQTYSRMNNG